MQTLLFIGLVSNPFLLNLLLHSEVLVDVVGDLLELRLFVPVDLLQLAQLLIWLESLLDGDPIGECLLKHSCLLWG